jgi:nicotinamidase-related amidase
MKKYFADTRPALLLIDIQSDYVDTMTPAFERKVRRVLDRARREGVPVIHVRYVTSETKSKQLAFKFEIGNEGRSHATYKRGGRLLPWTFKKGEPVCTKHAYDGFHRTTLHSMLQKRGVRTLYVAGLDTGVCVLSTMLTAFNLGYRIRLIESACVDSRPHRHRRTLQNYRNEIYLAAR